MEGEDEDICSIMAFLAVQSVFVHFWHVFFVQRTAREGTPAAAFALLPTPYMLYISRRTVKYLMYIVTYVKEKER